MSMSARQVLRAHPRDASPEAVEEAVIKLAKAYNDLVRTLRTKLQGRAGSQRLAVDWSDILLPEGVRFEHFYPTPRVSVYLQPSLPPESRGVTLELLMASEGEQAKHIRRRFSELLAVDAGLKEGYEERCTKLRQRIESDQRELAKLEGSSYRSFSPYGC